MRPILERYRDAYDEADWAAMAELLTPDIRWVDRRLVSWGEGSGREGLIEIMRGQLDLAPDMTLLEADVVAIGESASAPRHKYRGHFVIGGGEVEFGFALLVCAADGQV